MAPLRKRLNDVLTRFTQGQYNEAILEAVAVADENVDKPAAISCNLVAYFMVQQGSRSISSDLAENSFRGADRYYEISSEAAPNCIETAACRGAVLIALKFWNQAKVELERGLRIPDAKIVDPLLHHVTIRADGSSKGQRIAHAKQRMISDLSYIEIMRHDDDVFDKVMKKVSNPNAQATAILEASALLVDKVKTDRAKLFHAQLGLKLLRDRRLKDCEKHSVLLSALSALDELSLAHPNSLVISLHRSKLLVSLGHLDAAEKECCRALNIEKPDDPRNHNTPLVSTKGWMYQDRVLSRRMHVVAVLNTVVTMVRQRFDALSEEQKAEFLSVKVDKLLEFYEDDEDKSAIIHQAISYYKAQNSVPRIFLRCPFEIDKFLAPEVLLGHVCNTHMTVDSSVITQLMQCKFVPDLEHSYEALYLARDDEGSDRFCFTTLDALFGQISELLPGNKKKSNFQSTSLATFQDCIAQFQSQNIDASTLEKSWLQVLQAFAIDKCEVLMQLVAITKWEELKNVLEKQISEEEEVKTIADIQITDIQTSGIVAVEEPELLVEGLTQETGPKPVQRNYHAFMYGHRALRRKNSMTDAVTSAVSSNEDDSPYANQANHTLYAKERLKKLPHQETCTACYFELNTTKHLNQILFHLSNIHHSTGVKCPICSIRFLTAVALGYHMYYTHNVQTMEPPG